MSTIYTGLTNYYGGVFAYERNGEYFMGLDDVTVMQSIPISKEFYDAFVKEFEIKG